jgi:hypothetical protein
MIEIPEIRTGLTPRNECLSPLFGPILAITNLPLATAAAAAAPAPATAGTVAATLALFDRDGRMRQKICWIARQHVMFEWRLALDCQKFSNVSALLYVLCRATIYWLFENVQTYMQYWELRDDVAVKADEFAQVACLKLRKVNVLVCLLYNVTM